MFVLILVILLLAVAGFVVMKMKKGPSTPPMGSVSGSTPPAADQSTAVPAPEAPAAPAVPAPESQAPAAPTDQPPTPPAPPAPAA